MVAARLSELLGRNIPLVKDWVNGVDVQPGQVVMLENCRVNKGEKSDDPVRSEYICLVEWIKTVPRAEAKRRKTPKLYTTTHVRASLDRQPNTVAFLESAFGVNLREIAARE